MSEEAGTYQVGADQNTARSEEFDIAGPHNALLREWKDRVRILGRETAHHPETLRRVMAALDAFGPSEQGDVIQSLVSELVLARRLAYGQGIWSDT